MSGACKEDPLTRQRITALSGTKIAVNRASSSAVWVFSVVSKFMVVVTYTQGTGEIMLL